MKKICLLLLCCVIFFCGCEKESDNSTLYENYEYKEYVDWLEEESKEQDMLKNCEFIRPKLPIVLNYSFLGKLISKIEVTDCTYEFLILHNKPALKITLIGEMLYGDNEYTMFNYKLKDSDGYVIKTDHCTLDIMSKGDKFKDCIIYITNLEPGTYTIEFFDET